VVNSCQFIVDAGPAAKDLALMNALLEQATEVRDHYGAIVRYYEGNKKEIEANIHAFGRLASLSAKVDGRLTAAHAAIEKSGASAADFYAPFN